MIKKKSFKEFHEETLNESSWLSKGFAIGQGNRHSSTRRRLESLTSQVKSTCESGKRAEESDEKINALFDALIDISQCFRLQAELSQNVINVGVATNVLEDDIRTQLRRR